MSTVLNSVVDATKAIQVSSLNSKEALESLRRRRNLFVYLVGLVSVIVVIAYSLAFVNEQIFSNTTDNTVSDIVNILFIGYLFYLVSYYYSNRDTYARLET